MQNFIYGTVLAGISFKMFDIIDSNVSNGLWYWVDLYIPF